MRFKKLKDRPRPYLPKIRLESSQAKGEEPGAFVQAWRRITYNPSFNTLTLGITLILLAIIGIFMQYSASMIIELSKGISPLEGWIKPIIYTSLGLAFFTIAYKLPASLYTLYLSWVIFIGGLLMQCSVFFFGIEQGGNRNWILIPGTHQPFQPSEVLKLCFIIFITHQIAYRRYNPKDFKSVGLYLFLPYIVCVLAVMIGKDLGTALIFTAIAFTIYIVCGVNNKYWGSLLCLGLAGVAILVLISPSRMKRITNFFSGGEADPLGLGLQSLRAKWALGTGGLTGVGAGASRQKWKFLPEAHTDFIYAILGEEFGLFGTLAVLILFAILAYVLIRIIVSDVHTSTRVYAAGLFGWIIFQALVNICVVVGLMPVLGVPLPFISSGGSSLVTSYAAFGVLFSLLNQDKKRVKLSDLSNCFSRKSSSVQTVNAQPGSKRKTVFPGGKR